MRWFISLTLLISLSMAQPTPYEQNPDYTATYPEVLTWYRALADQHPARFRLTEAGSTDAGLPLMLGILSLDGNFDPDSLRSAGRTIVFINNGIHPGEPEGIDATMMLVRDLLKDPTKKPLLQNTTLIFVPVYNVGGCLNRNSRSRTNQNGPDSYGFRGNSRNLDLNRDFVKCDSREALAFNRIFATWQPHVFLDNHTSNGADYQYTMTLIPTQPTKLGPVLGPYLKNEMTPALYKAMAEKGWDMCPYVVTKGETPETGLIELLEPPMLSTGYAALHHTLAFMTETHMLKEYAPRVQSTYTFMECLLAYAATHGDRIRNLREQAVQKYTQQPELPLYWVLDDTQHEYFTFKGYKALYKPSQIGSYQRLYYDRSQSWQAPVPFYTTYQVEHTATLPTTYYLPQAWADVALRLEANGIRMTRLEHDTLLTLDCYYITDRQPTTGPYEGRYKHEQFTLQSRTLPIQLRKGDYVIETNQPGARYLLETLEPLAHDSFFRWGFFDQVLMKKEWYSDYVYEDQAAELLRTEPGLQARFDEWKAQNPAKANDQKAVLDWIFLHSSRWHEPEHNRLPVYRSPR